MERLLLGSRRRWRLSLLIALLGALFAASPQGFSLEEELGLAWLFAIRGERAAPKDVVIVGLDGATLSRLRELGSDVESWPGPLRACERRHGGLGTRLVAIAALDRLPRAFYGCLVEELDRRGADVIAFDIAFRFDPDREDGVLQFANAIADHGYTILLEHAERRWMINSTGLEGGLTSADTVKLPHPELTDAAMTTAPFILPKATGRINQFWVRSGPQELHWQLPAVALKARAQRANERWVEGSEPLPGDRQHIVAADRLNGMRSHYYLGFYGAAGTIRSVSAADILAPGLGHGAGGTVNDLRGKTVFVGFQERAVAEGIDIFPTVFRNQQGIDLAGVEIGATAYLNLLHDEMLKPPSEASRLFIVFLTGLLFASAAFYGSVWRGLVLTLSAGLAYIVLVIALFAELNIWLPLFVPVAVLLPVAIVAGQLEHYLGAARWLGVYAPRQISERVLSGDERLAAGAERRTVTVMLTDIVGFTSFAEQTSPEEVTRFVNRHFTMLGRTIEQENGVLAQFIGDSVMAFWGAPDLQPDHAARACRTALAIADAMEAENALRAREGAAPVRMRIGLNTGEVTAGNVGTPGRSSYGIVGDTVNSTQRIEQLGKTLAKGHPVVAILVSEHTRAAAGDGFIFEDAGEWALRGREQVEKIFQLMGHEAAADAETRAASALAHPHSPARRRTG